MASRELLLPWTQQPQEAVQVDPDSPAAIGLVAWLPGNGQLYDASSYRRPVNIIGNPQIVAGGPPEYPGLVPSWDGIDDEVEVPNFPFLPEVTCMAWVFNLRSSDYYRAVISRGDVFAADSNFTLGLRTNPTASDNRVFMYGRNGGSLVGIEGGGSLMNDLTWYHIAGTSKNGAHAVYINGVSVATSASSAATDGGQMLKFGAPYATGPGTYRFNSPAFDLRVYDRVMPASELLDVYRAGPWALFEPQRILVPVSFIPPTGTNVNPAVGSIVITGYAPTVSQSVTQVVVPGTGSLVITGHAPTVTQTAHIGVAPGVGTLTITGYAPTIQQSSASSIVPGVGTITITGYAPTIAASANQTIIPAVGPIVITGYAPSVTQSDNKQVIPGVGSISLVGHIPTIVQSSGQSVLPITGNLVITGHVPVVTRTLHSNLFPGQGNLIITGYAPSVVRTTGGAGGLSATDVWQYEIEAGRTAEELMRMMAAVLLGKTTVTDHGDGTATVTFEASNGSKIRVTAEMTGSQRTLMTYDDSF